VLIKDIKLIVDMLSLTTSIYGIKTYIYIYPKLLLKCREIIILKKYSFVFVLLCFGIYSTPSLTEI